ncbi:MAG: Gfo/Idh/MocA family oxidoreductase [Clostridiales bacterium]|jgi:predicted dehydrogenase|nr:Gfo/Idh/MocA family oxidoreductase [Clostridiales bacterium]
MTNRDFGLCFIGAGSIARRVLADISKHSKGCYLASIYSRQLANAERLSSQHGGIPCASIDEAMGAPGVKAVYVATPNTFHKEHSVNALKKGLPVLCEKPVATTLLDLKEMAEAARDHSAFFMEGMWTAHNPAVKKAVEWAKEGQIGKLRAMSASFSSRSKYDPKSRLFDPSLGGGALFDIGVYTVAMARLLFSDMPEELEAVAEYAPTGVDSQCAVTMKYKDGAIARLFCGTSANEPDECLISGEQGFIRLEKFWAPKKAQLFVPGHDAEIFDGNFPGEGFQFEFDAMREDVLAGRIENALVPHEFSFSVMELVERIGESCQKQGILF